MDWSVAMYENHYSLFTKFMASAIKPERPSQRLRQVAMLHSMTVLQDRMTPSGVTPQRAPYTKQKKIVRKTAEYGLKIGTK